MVLLALAPLILISGFALIAFSAGEHPSFEGGMVRSCYCRSCTQKLSESQAIDTKADFEGSLIAA